MNFGEAIEVLKGFGTVSRRCWNGSGMYLELVPGALTLGPYIQMVDTQGFRFPWLASQTDILAEDWYRVNGTKAHERVSKAAKDLAETDPKERVIYARQLRKLREAIDVAIAEGL